MVFWVFGYGSLVWNPGFVYDKKIIGFIKDYRRVFDLACIDHRGTPENPARTCTLEQIEGAICWGAAYCVQGGPEKERLAMEYLERRECEYDHKTLVDFYREEDPLQPALTGVVVFTSTPDVVSNKYYLGPAPLEEMARQIATASGPCGNNRDYLFKLEKALFDIGHEEDMVIELANEVRKVLGVGKGVGLMALITDAKLGFHAAWVATIKMYFVIMGLGPGVLSLFRPRRSWWDYTQNLKSQDHIPALQTSLLAEAVAAD